MALDRPDCFICRKHARLEAQPPGGYLYADDCWRVCHAPTAMSIPGELLIESRRHLLDFAGLNDDEAACYGPLLRRLYSAIKQATGAPRVYTLITLEDASHLHIWLIPRPEDADARGITFLQQDHTCTEAEAVAMAQAIKEAMAL